MISAGTVPTASDEVSFYVARHYTSPSAHLQRMTVRTDGFASAHADYSGGELITRPLTFTGRRLEINFSSSAAGSLRIEMQDTDGRPIDGFALADCPEIFGDEIRRVVRFKRGHDVGRLAGTPVRLRLVMKDADVYAFRFTE